MRETIETQHAPKPIGPYSQAIRANGFVFVSGQIPINPESGDVTEREIGAQTRQVMRNIGAILEAAGSSMDEVVKTTIFLASLDDFSRMNEVYSEFLGSAKPARATVEVARLPKEVLVEIEAIALARP